MKSYILKVFSEAEVGKIKQMALDIRDTVQISSITTHKTWFGMFKEDIAEVNIPKHLEGFVDVGRHVYPTDKGVYLINLAKQLKMSRDVYLDHEASSIVLSVLG